MDGSFMEDLGKMFMFLFWAAVGLLVAVVALGATVIWMLVH